MSVIENSFKKLTLNEALLDLGVRFILNCPPEDISTSERLFFQLEEAHWFYVDFVHAQNKMLPLVSLKLFVELLYTVLPVMKTLCANPNKALSTFKSYKNTIPVRGAIIINESRNKLLMVRTWRGNSWGFPKGKINKEEDDAVCAAREVEEETGFNIMPYLVRDQYSERTLNGKNTRLYIITGIPESTVFETQTRMEIGKIDWVPVNQVFNQKRNNIKYYRVHEFLPDIKPFLNLRKPKGKAAATTADDNEAKASHLMSLLQPKGSENAVGDDTQELEGDNEGVDAEKMDQIETQQIETEDILKDYVTDDIGSRKLLDTLKREVASDKKATAIQDAESMAPSSQPDVDAPALPPNSILESLVEARKNKPRTRSPAPGRTSRSISRNALLNVLNSGKTKSYSKLMDLLNPGDSNGAARATAAKPKPKLPKKSSLMNLLDEEVTETTQKETLKTTTEVATKTDGVITSAVVETKEKANVSKNNKKSRPLLALLDGSGSDSNPKDSASSTTVDSNAMQELLVKKDEPIQQPPPTLHEVFGCKGKSEASLKEDSKILSAIIAKMAISEKPVRLNTKAKLPANEVKLKSTEQAPPKKTEKNKPKAKPAPKPKKQDAKGSKEASPVRVDRADKKPSEGQNKTPKKNIQSKKSAETKDPRPNVLSQNLIDLKAEFDRGVMDAKTSPSPTPAAGKGGNDKKKSEKVVNNKPGKSEKPKPEPKVTPKNQRSAKKDLLSLLAEPQASVPDTTSPKETKKSKKNLMDLLKEE